MAVFVYAPKISERFIMNKRNTTTSGNSNSLAAWANTIARGGFVPEVASSVPMTIVIIQMLRNLVVQMTYPAIFPEPS